MLNLSPLFYTTDENEACLYTALDLGMRPRNYIAEAKTDVRNCLRVGIPRVLKSNGYASGVPQPRFFTQGSWAYKTLNAPAQDPQQADVDDGCYLPLSFVSQTIRPSVAATVFFAAAEEALSPLVKDRRWKLITDKLTCIRPHGKCDLESAKQITRTRSEEVCVPGSCVFGACDSSDGRHRANLKHNIRLAGGLAGKGRAHPSGCQ